MLRRDVLLVLINKSLYILTDEMTAGKCVYFINNEPIFSDTGIFEGKPITSIKWVLAEPKQIGYVNRGVVIDKPDHVNITPIHEGDVDIIFDNDSNCQIEVQTNNEPVYLDGKVIIFLP